MSRPRTCPDFPWPVRTYPGKRALDVVLATAALVLFSPVMLLAAASVKLTSRGPVVYRGRRVGLCGQAFDQFKFRSMYIGTGGTGFTKSADDRITPVGRVIRLLKIDELPQLFNVLRGEMSLVGPRPEDASLVDEQYDGEQLRVLSARPGLTCIVEVRWFPDFSYYLPPEVDPDEHYRRHLLPQRLRDDLEYVDRMSLWLDLKLIVQTIYCIGIKGWWIVLRHKLAARRDAASHCDAPTRPRV